MILEKVLCVPRKSVAVLFSDNQQFIQASKAILKELLAFQFYGVRDKLEKDNRFKQIIPYILVRRKQELLCYRRKGNEKRLTGLLSVGIGGHVEFGEWPAFAARREFREELKGPCVNGTSLNFVGIINEDYSDVGKVHVGLVYVAEISHVEELESNESHLIDLHFEGIHSLLRRKEEMEPWSRICIYNLNSLF